MPFVKYLPCWVFSSISPSKEQAKKSPQRKRSLQTWVLSMSYFHLLHEQTHSAVKSKRTPTPLSIVPPRSLRMLSLRRLREMALPQRWPLLRSQRRRMLQERVELSPNRAKLKKPLKHQKKELRNQQLKKPERKLQRWMNRERKVLQLLRKPRGDEERSDAGTWTVFIYLCTCLPNKDFYRFSRKMCNWISFNLVGEGQWFKALLRWLGLG